MAPGLTHLGTISLLTLPGDNGTWSVTIFTAAGDQPLKNLRQEDKWTNTMRACPLHAHWLNGEPITGVLAMGGVVDRYRRFVVDGRPVATGFVAVADAWACTNPSAGRGLTVGFLHALRLRDTLRETSDNPHALVEEFDRRTEAEIAPWYRAQIAVDRARFAEMDALREGRAPTPPADPLAREIGKLFSSLARRSRPLSSGARIRRNDHASAGDSPTARHCRGPSCRTRTHEGKATDADPGPESAAAPRPREVTCDSAH